MYKRQRAYSAIKTNWATTLVGMIRANDDAEFDSILAVSYTHLSTTWICPWNFGNIYPMFRADEPMSLVFNFDQNTTPVQTDVYKRQVRMRRDVTGLIGYSGIFTVFTGSGCKLLIKHFSE